MKQLKHLKYLKVKGCPVIEGDIITFTSEKETPVEVGDTLSVEYTQAEVIEVLDNGKILKGKIKGNPWVSGINYITGYAISKEQKYGEFTDFERIKAAKELIESVFDEFIFEEKKDGKIYLRTCKARVSGGEKMLETEDSFLPIYVSGITFYQEITSEQ